MKKLFTLFIVLLAGNAAFAQLPNPGMETWHSGMSGDVSPKYVEAPDGWYGVDSLAIATLQFYLTDTSGTQQLFKDGTTVHGGTYAAKLVSIALTNGFLNSLPGILVNAQPVFDFGSLSFGYMGGTSISQRITHVSAWVKYSSPGTDTASISAQAVLSGQGMNGTDSVVGTGTTYIFPTGASYTQATANINYISNFVVPDKIIVVVASGSLVATVPGSTLYVDDFTMDALGIANTQNKGDAVALYPNPTTGNINLISTQNAGLSCHVYGVNGKVVATKLLTGNDRLDLSALSSGFYMYNIANKAGTVIQTGKITLNK